MTIYSEIPQQFSAEAWSRQDFFVKQIEEVVRLYSDLAWYGINTKKWENAAPEEAGEIMAEHTLARLEKFPEGKKALFEQVLKAILIELIEKNFPRDWRDYYQVDLSGSKDFLSLHVGGQYGVPCLILDAAKWAGLGHLGHFDFPLKASFKIDSIGRVYLNGIKQAIQDLPQYNWFEVPRRTFKLYEILSGQRIDDYIVFVHKRDARVLEHITLEDIRRELEEDSWGNGEEVRFLKKYRDGSGRGNRSISVSILPDKPRALSGNLKSSFMELHNGKPEDDKFEVVRKLQGTSLCYVEEDSLLESLRGELPVALKKGDVVFTDECRGVRLLELEESGHEAGWRFDCNQLVGPDNKPLHASETLLSARLIHDLATYHATGKTPLMKAAEEGDITTVKFLLKRGANSEERSKNGQDTAIDLAKRNGHHNVVKYLRGAGKHSYLGQQRNSPGF